MDQEHTRKPLGLNEPERDLFQQLFLANPIAMILCTEHDDVVLQTNVAAAKLLGSSPQALAGRRLSELSVFADAEGFRQFVSRCHDERSSLPFDVHLRNLTGAALVCECTVVKIAMDGRVCLLATLVDVTGRARAEQGLRSAEAETRTARDTLENLLNAIPDVIGLQDRSHRVLRYNAAGYRFLGITADQLEGRKCFELIGRSQPCEVCATTQAVASREPVQFEKHFPELNVWLDARAYPILDDSGQVTMVIEHLRDITEHKRSIEERERLFNLSLDLLCIAGFDGRFHQVNPAWTKALGWSRDELLAAPWLEFVHPEDRDATVEAADQLIAGKPVIDFENRYLCKDGSHRLLSWNSLPLPSDGVTFAVVRDLTETRRMQERLQHVEKMDAIGQLAGGIAHDFNNQLVGILGFSELLSRRLDDPELKRFAEGIVTAARRSADLTRSLLTFSRAGKRRSERIDVHGLMGEVVMLLEHTIDKRIVIKQDFRASNPMVQGDPAQLQSAFLNLTLNARDAMANGGELVLSTTESVFDEERCASYAEDLQPGRYLCVSVTDNGTGMDEATRKHIFEPFFTTKGAGRGLGLGLPAVYGAARSHGGIVTVYSEVGHGTTFRVYLPLLQPSRTQEGLLRHKAPTKAARKARILLVDDEQVVRDVATEALLQAGYEVVSHATGPEAIAHFRDAWGETDLVILDMIMPEMTGQALFSALREINPDVKAILATGFSLNGEARKILADGVLGFVQKPFHIQELLESVAEALDR
jgi:PAS domain S-box-containing protein